jgi:glycoside/pentoside/hexuronide:cation symporter, GPH family
MLDLINDRGAAMNKKLKFLTFSSGNFANTLAYQVLGNRVQFYYIDILGLAPAVAGIVWTIFGIWNMVNDPLMGQVTDRTRTRMGRRVPYVFFGAIPLGLSFFFLWTPPTTSPWVTAAYFFVMLFIFDTLYTITIIAYNALFPEVATTMPDRISLSTFREVLAVIALLLSYIAAPILSETLGFVWMGAIIGALIAIGYLITVIGVKEAPVSKDEKTEGILQSLKIVLSSFAFRLFVVFNLMKEYVFLILGATLPFWRKYVLGIQGPGDVFGINLGAGDQEAILLGLPFILCIPALMIWQRFVPRIGPRQAWLLSNLLFIPGLLVMTFARNFYSGLLGTVLIVPGLSGYLILPLPLLSEVIEDDERRHGVKRAGMFFGMNGGIVKAAFSMQGLLFAAVFSVSGYVAGAEIQSESAIWGISFLIGITPLISIIISTLSLWKFPLGRETTGKASISEATAV